MAKLLLLPLMMVLWMLLQALQVDEEKAIHTLFHAKHAVNRAAHAAAQQLDPAALALGEVRILAPEALASALQYLAYNLRLDESGQPLPDAILSSPAEVLHFEVVNGDRSFPYLYRAEAFNYEVTLQRPGVVLIVRIRYPRAFSVLEPVEWVVKGAAELVW